MIKKKPPTGARGDDEMDRKSWKFTDRLIPYVAPGGSEYIICAEWAHSFRKSVNLVRVTAYIDMQNDDGWEPFFIAETKTDEIDDTYADADMVHISGGINIVYDSISDAPGEYGGNADAIWIYGIIRREFIALKSAIGDCDISPRGRYLIFGDGRILGEDGGIYVSGRDYVDACAAEILSEQSLFDRIMFKKIAPSREAI